MKFQWHTLYFFVFKLPFSLQWRPHKQSLRCAAKSPFLSPTIAHFVPYLTFSISPTVFSASFAYCCNFCLYSISLILPVSLSHTPTPTSASFHPPVCWGIKTESHRVLRAEKAVIYLPCWKDKEDDCYFSPLHTVYSLSDA